MALFLNILFVLFFAFTAPFWILQLLRSKKYRAGWPQRLGWVPKREGKQPCIWIHGVSVGEILTARTFVRRLEERHPGWDVVLSTTTLEAHRVVERTYPGKMLFFFPMELSFVIRRTLRRIRPTAVVLIEQELWPNFLHHCDRAGIPAILVNGRISRRSYRLYSIVRWPLFRPFRKVRSYCVQTQEVADRFAALGIPRAQIDVTGNMKYDNIATGEGGAKAGLAARRQLSISSAEWVLIGGSTHSGEEHALLDTFEKIRARRVRSRLVLVPRHTERIPQVEALLRERQTPYVLKTDLDRGADGKGKVILVDTMGELLHIYPAADVVFIGGSLVPVGGHNMLEPAGLGLAVVIGPHVFKCKEEVDLLVKEGAGLMAKDAEDLTAILLDMLDHPEKARAMGEKAARTLTARQGATDRNLAHLDEALGITSGGPGSPSRTVSVAAG